MPITRINEFHAAPEKWAALRAFLNTDVATVGGTRGCLNVDFFVDPEDDSRFAIVESWESVAGAVP